MANAGARGWVNTQGHTTPFRNFGPSNFASPPIFAPALSYAFSATPELENNNVASPQTRIASGRRQLQCGGCKSWINCGAGSSNNALIQHLGSNQCMKNQRKYECERVGGVLKTIRDITNAPEAQIYGTPTSTEGNRELLPTRQEQQMMNTVDFAAELPAAKESTQNLLPNVTSGSDTPCCAGLRLDWRIGSFFRMFPVQYFELEKSKFHLTRVSSNGTEFWIRSKGCTGFRTAYSTICDPCQSMRQYVDNLEARANTPSSFTQHTNLSIANLSERVNELQDDLRKEKLKNLGLGRRLSTALGRVSDSARLGMLIATNKVAGISRLMRTALQERVSTSEILHRVERAIQGEYHARGYDADDVDLAVLVYRLGGSRLLYALNHALGLPSVTAMRQQLQQITLLPSIGKIDGAEIMENITSMFGGERNAEADDEEMNSSLCGHSFSADEISLDEQGCYMSRGSKVGGLCREHTGDIDLTIRDVHSLADIADSVCSDNPTIHYAREATVGAIAPFRRANASAWPILVSGTCKSEEVDETKRIIELVLRCWKESSSGEKRWGPIWSCASDGDSTRRAAFYDLLMSEKLCAGDRLYEKLGSLPGLNLFTGKDGVTMDFDYKHLFKRFCTLLSSDVGMAVNHVVINRGILRTYMLMFNDHTASSVDALLKPYDAQDVGRAIELLQTVYELRNLDTSNFTPAQLSTHSSITLIGELAHSLTEPFINRELSLTQQIEHLSRYAHLAFALYRQHTTSFTSNQFYGDSQAMVKNALFVVAKQQQMNPQRPLYLVQVGDDRLENLFGRVRMLGGHNPNCTFKTLTERLAAAVGIADIFLRHPSWDSGSRRLSMKRQEHLDHLKPSLWKGGVISGSVDLKSAWANGREGADAVLGARNIQPDFLTLFSQFPDIDLMRPMLGGKYPGVTAGTDRSIATAVPPEQALANSHPSSTPQHLESSNIPTTIPCPDEDDTDNNDAHDQPSSEVADLPSIELADLLPDPQTPALSLGDNDPGTTSPASTVSSASDWLQFEGKSYHKASLVRTFFTHGPRKSFDRVNRVKAISGIRTFSSQMSSVNFNSDNIFGGDAFAVGDLFAALIRTGDTVAMGVFQSTSLEQRSLLVQRVSESELPLQAANIKLTGQLLELHPTSVPASTIPNPIHSPLPDGPPAPITLRKVWAWTGGFVQLLPLKTKAPDAETRSTSEMITKKSLVLSFPSHMVAALPSSVSDPNSVLLPDHPIRKKSITRTWTLDHDVLETLSLSLWQSALEHQWLSKLPSCGLSAGKTFPYSMKDDNATRPFFVITVDAGMTFDDSAPCGICDRRLKSNTNRRNHVGGHILRAQCVVVEEGIKTPVAKSNPCGFCGRESTNGQCSVTMTTTASPKVVSTCRLAHDFKYGYARKGSPTTPSTNVPVICRICTPPSALPAKGTTLVPAIWRYNLLQHIKIEHPGTVLSTLPLDFLQIIQTSDNEYTELNVPQEQIPARIQPLAEAASTSQTTASKRKHRMDPSSLPNASRRRL